MTETTPKGRVAEFDPEHVRDVSNEYLRDYYKRNVEEFHKQVKRQADLDAYIRKQKAIFHDSFTRKFLAAWKQGHRAPEEICYQIYRANMIAESATPKELTSFVTQAEWRKNSLCYIQRVKNYIRAYRAVLAGETTPLENPPEAVSNAVESEDDDGFL